jgi:tRNA modification GTPase
VINDGEAPWDDGARFAERALVVKSKGDVSSSNRGLVTSATTGEGLDQLKAAVLSIAGVADSEGGEQPFVTTARQQALAAAARDAFAAARAARVEKAPAEVIAIELRTAAQSLAQLRGVEVGDRVLDELFARFCIGK